ncbi:hypothetical protein SASPL_107192 [Salvia splendens]|uniref:Trichome birefringence-like C-terminal domain-containing protein n=1 Tax=Salvia splendens TaxID=180675 RepID=A0A8X8Y9X2_SALSN|nr:hypothetical protein SASPL_107192 [Salvia splendens]
MSCCFDSGGDWNTGGGCDLETFPDLTASPMSPETLVGFKTVVDALSERQRLPVKELLNVTSMTSQRRDMHSSYYYLGPAAQPSALQHQDCSHWCLPDSWNELLDLCCSYERWGMLLPWIDHLSIRHCKEAHATGLGLSL